MKQVVDPEFKFLRSRHKESISMKANEHSYLLIESQQDSKKENKPCKQKHSQKGFRTFLYLLVSFIISLCFFIYFFTPHRAVSIPWIGKENKADSSLGQGELQYEKQVLPTSVTPIHYSLQFITDFQEFKFQGEAQIDLKVHTPTNEIKFNAVELQIPKEKIELQIKKDESDTPSPLSLKEMSYDESRQEVTLVFKDILPKGFAHLRISFVGVHNDKMAGFYRSSYLGVDGKQKYMVVTQFEATDARRAFPCWDEPSSKATFDVSLSVPNEMTALSNMPDIETKAHPTLANYKSVRFSRTPIMSTYLLAFAVGEFDFLEKTSKIGDKSIPVRVYATKGLAHQGEFALDCACQFLTFFSTKFNIPYALPKMDMLAVPDFSAGAMENWGLVTYRTVMLLVDPNNTSSLTQQRVAYVVAHELAHQWFGNLVTMEWWDELWLNEGFATWVGWYAVDHFFPSWQVWSQFVNNELGKALELDALQSSHPIQVPVFRPSEISQIFDSISYSKGASVIRMLSTWLGVDLFIQGVAVYLHRHQYKNAATEDLWDALNEATGKNVREFMTLWTKQVGYPVLDISLETKKKDAVSGNTPRVLRVQQARFLTGSQSTPASLSSTREDTVQKPWWCPLGLVHVEGAMLKATEDQFFLPPDSSDPLDSVLNVGQSNFYRVHYPKELLDTFCEWNQQLHEVDRAGLISDAFSLSMHGEYTSLVPLQFVEAESTLIQKRQSSSSSVPFSYIALLQIEAGLSKMKEVWAFEPSLPHFKKMLRQVFSPVVQYLGWEFTTKDDHLHGLLRTLAISTAGLNEDMVVVQQALRYVQDDVLLKQVHPNLRGSAYAMAIKHGGMEYYHRIQQQVYLNEQLTMDQRLSALSALGYLQQESDIKTLLEFVFEKVRTQDWIYPFRTASMQHRLFVWRYLKQRWDKLEAVFQPSMLAHTVHLTSGWADMQLATTEIISFFKQRNTALYDRALQQALEKIKMQEAWLNKDRDAVSEWLQSHLYTKP